VHGSSPRAGSCGATSQPLRWGRDRGGGGPSRVYFIYFIYFIFLNLASTLDGSTTWTVNFMPRPFRSYRIGLT
jgi:hypothetical protein